jgi:Fic family protein
MLTAVETTSQWTTQKIKAIRALMDHTDEIIRAEAPKIHSHDLVQQIFTQPYSRIRNLITRGIAKRQTASTYLRELVRLGVLEEEKVGRDKIFLHRKYLDLLTSEEHSFQTYSRSAQLGTLRKPLEHLRK